MSFFQNVFDNDFSGSMLLGDRQFIPSFVVKRNAGRGAELVYAWNQGPYNLSGNDASGNTAANLLVSFALHNDKNWATITVPLTNGAASTSAVTTAEAAASMNAYSLFSERFIATVGSYNQNRHPQLMIKQRKPVTEFKFYVQNTNGESVLGFNARAGITELPTYFARHSVANRFNFVDSEGALIALDEGNAVDRLVINNAKDAYGVSLGYDYTAMKEDWELMKGRSGIFNFQKLTVDASDRITEIIEYPAGAIAGDLARKIAYTYTGTNKNPNQITEIPYTLESGDLVTP